VPTPQPFVPEILQEVAPERITVAVEEPALRRVPDDSRPPVAQPAPRKTMRVPAINRRDVRTKEHPDNYYPRPGFR
jgi:hypothetical protein